MLNGMAEDYEVNSVYVLDLYRHGKVDWMLDFAIQIAVVVLLGSIYLSISGGQDQKDHAALIRRINRINKRGDRNNGKTLIARK